MGAAAAGVGLNFSNIVQARAKLLTGWMFFVATARRNAILSLPLNQQRVKVMVYACGNVPAIAAFLDLAKMVYRDAQMTAALLYISKKGNCKRNFHRVRKFVVSRMMLAAVAFFDVNMYL